MNDLGRILNAPMTLGSSITLFLIFFTLAVSVSKRQAKIHELESKIAVLEKAVEVLTRQKSGRP